MLTSYGYSSDGWGDKLKSFNGQAITYDSIGNPLTYYNGSSYSFTWQGRQLVGATKGNKTMSFEYNADGIRTSKTVNGVETKYYLNGSQIVAEVNPNYSIMYIYDAEGSPIGMQYRASSYAEGVFDYYFFEKNLQGDIVAVYGKDGTKYLEYFYDAWGNFQIGYHNAGNLTPAILNPFAYRGYYYDADLNLYYLNSRYYDQNTRRFISPDAQISDDILGKNLYLYCGNNPVTRKDDTGEGWLFAAICGAVGALFNAGEKVVSNISEGKKWSEGILGAAAGGFVGGFVGTFGGPAAGSYAGATTESLVNEITSYTSWSEWNNDEQKDLTVENIGNSLSSVAKDTIKNGTKSLITDKISSKIIPTNKGWFQPKKLSSCLWGKYAKKVHARTVLQIGMDMGFDMINQAFSKGKCQIPIISIH